MDSIELSLLILFLFLQIGVDTRIMRVLNYYCKRNNKRK